MNEKIFNGLIGGTIDNLSQIEIEVNTNILDAEKALNNILQIATATRVLLESMYDSLNC